jgi:hypothetical protein
MADPGNQTGGRRHDDSLAWIGHGEMMMRVNEHSEPPIRQQPTEPLEHGIEGGGVPRHRVLPGIQPAGFLSIDSTTVTRAIEDLKRSGYRPLAPGQGGPSRPMPEPAKEPVKEDEWIDRS